MVLALAVDIKRFLNKPKTFMIKQVECLLFDNSVGCLRCLYFSSRGTPHLKTVFCIYSSYIYLIY